MSPENESGPGAPGPDIGTPSNLDHTGSDFQASTVNTSLTPKRLIEVPAYAGMVRRVTTALGRRVASGDLGGLAELVALSEHLDTVIINTIAKLRIEHGYSWAEIGRELGVSKQAAQQRWGKKDAHASWDHSGIERVA